ncbi:MAG: hypothetical protein IJT62_05655 [Oscillospiraceae bacterium]|nr:hypothetical protein [Oscillospiraceae bacterium]
MNKGKALFITTIIGVLLATVIWCMWSYAIRSFTYFIVFFGAYGFACFIVHLGKWMMATPTNPRHVRGRADEDEDDAAIWEHAGDAYCPAVTSTEGKA